MRRRLIVVSLAVTSMVALAFLIPLMLLVRDLAADRALLAAEQEAETAARLVGLDTAAGFTDLGFEGLSLILPDGSVVGEPLQPGESLSGPQSGAAGSQPVDGGVAVYVPVVDGEGELLVVRNFVTDEELTEGVGRSWLILSVLALALVGGAVGVASWLGTSMVKPVEELSRAAARLGQGDLDSRVGPSGPPELESVGKDFNYLAQRVSELLQHERENAADLSHRLRTPLTAARLDAESLPAGEDRERILDDLAELERTVDHIITDARTPAQNDGVSVDITRIVTERANFWHALAEEQSRPCELFVATVQPVRCEVDGPNLAASLDALLGNVFAHTEEGVGYRVGLMVDRSTAIIEIDDSGPGVVDESVLDRGESPGGSTGLGLDIARRTAESAGGGLEIGSSPLGGTQVTMHLPLADP